MVVCIVNDRLQRSLRALTVVLAVACSAACSGSSTAPTTTKVKPTSAFCGSMAGKQATITKVMVIVMENTSFDSVIGSNDAPTINALADDCGLATNYHGIQFPSLPNYIQMTSGTAPPSIAGDGRRGSDCTPAPDCQSTDPSVFSQLEAAHLSWKSYAESMPSNCFLHDQGNYVPRHNPAVYYINDRASCKKFDVPMGATTEGALAGDLRRGELPSYSFVVPNLCNDGHDSCGGTPPVVEEDRFMTEWMPKIASSPDYKSGNLVVVLTADTSAGSDPSNHLATIMISPTIRPHTVATADFNHYSLLRMSEDLTGLKTHLGAAATAADMLPAFGLTPISGG